MQKVTVNGAKAEKCLVHAFQPTTSKEKMGDILTLTPKYLKMVHDDQELVDMYGQVKTKAEFIKDRKGVLYPSETGGATIFGLLIINE